MSDESATVSTGSDGGTTSAARSPLLDLPGAVPADGPDTGVALHYGDPIAEQRALATGVGLVDRGHRPVIQVGGPDRLSWLHDITSQHLSALPDGHGTEALVLSPHGHVEHHLMVAELGGVTWLDVEPATSRALLDYLESMRFLLRVTPAEVSAEWALASLVGPDTGRALAQLGVTGPDEPYAVTGLADGGWVRAMPWPGQAAADLMVPRAALPGLVERLRAAGVVPAGSWAFEALRVQARRPRLGLETDHRTIPHEVGWIGVAVHLDKGCYRGQETVARVHNLGRPPRRMVLLHLDGSEDVLPASGDPVTLDGRQVGFVGTAVRHHELGPIALALVKRNTPEQAVLSAGGVPASPDTGRE